MLYDFQYINNIDCFETNIMQIFFEVLFKNKVLLRIK